MIWIVLGGAVGVWGEYNDALTLAPSSKTIAVNDAGVIAPRHLDAWATLHPENFHAWQERRKEYGNTDYQAFSIDHSGPWAKWKDRWEGSSGLFAAQIALEGLGASGVILCGCPLTKTGRHFFDKNNEWDDAEVYRKGFKAAFPVIQGSVRSLSGWTRELLGAPSAQWLADRAKAHKETTSNG